MRVSWVFTKRKNIYRLVERIFGTVVMCRRSPSFLNTPQVKIGRGSTQLFEAQFLENLLGFLNSFIFYGVESFGSRFIKFMMKRTARCCTVLTIFQKCTSSSDTDRTCEHTHLSIIHRVIFSL